MKTNILILVFSMLALALSAQVKLDRLERAPGPGYVPQSDADGKYTHALLDTSLTLVTTTYTSGDSVFIVTASGDTIFTGNGGITILGNYPGSRTKFAPDTDVMPDTTGTPSLNEIRDWNDQVEDTTWTNSVIFYTGTNDSTDAVTFVYFIDSDRKVSLLESPGQINNFTRRIVPGPAFAESSDPTEAEVLVFIGNLTPPPRPFTVFVLADAGVAGSGSANNPEAAWIYDGVNVTNIEKFPQKFQVPGTAFADSTDPSGTEVLTWMLSNPQTGNDLVAYLVGSGSVEDPDYVWALPGDKTVGKTDILLVKKPSAGGSSAFDSNRNILRTFTVGTNIAGSTVQDVLEWMYFSAPTLSFNFTPTTTVFEIGTSNQVILSGATTNPGTATLSGGVLYATIPGADTLLNFGTATSYADTITFTPQQGGSGNFNNTQYTFRASQAWVKGSENGTALSGARTLFGVYPVLYGMSATDFTSTGNPYTSLTKLVETESNKTVSLTGSGYIYFLVPKSWSDWNLSSIIDHNGFNVTGSFTATDINISSTGLVNDYSTVAYRMYKLNTTTTTSGFAYQFNR